MRAFLRLARLSFLHRWRSLLAVGQRSILVLLALPLAVVGAYYVLDHFDDQLFSLFTKASPLERLGVLRDALVATWLGTFVVMVGAALARPEGADERPWAVAVLPTKERTARLAVAAPWMLLLALACALLGSLFGRQVGPALALYGAPAFWTGALLTLFFVGAVASASALPRIAAALAARWTARAPRLAPLAEIGGLCVFLAIGVLFLPRVRGVLAAGLDDYFSGWLSTGQLPIVAALKVLLVPAIALVAAAWLSTAPRAARVSISRKSGLGKRSSNSTEPWRVIAAHDVRLFRRERNGLVTAVIAQVFFAVVLSVGMNLPALRDDAALRQRVLFNLTLGMPLVWSVLAVLSFGLDVLGGQQLLSAPVSLGDRTWGKLRAALVYCGANWGACMLVLVIVFDARSVLGTAGTSLATLVLGISAAFLAGRILPVELRRSGATGGGSFHTWVLAASFMGMTGGAILWGTSVVQEATSSLTLASILRVTATFACALFFFHATQRVQLRHGLDPR